MPNQRSILYVFLIIITGSIIGSLFGEIIASFIPEGTVKDFFLLKTTIGWGADINNWVKLGVFRFKTGLFIDFNVVSLLGMFVAWYFLRYFK